MVSSGTKQKRKMERFWSINKGTPDRAPPTKNTAKAPKNGGLEPILGAVLVAGAEGLEPSARGFGVDVGRHSTNITAGVFGGVEPFSNSNHTPQNFLMIY